MRFVELIRRKRDGHSLSADEIAWMVREYSADRLPDYQMSAWLMAALLRGLNTDELAALTESMLHSGSVLDFSDVSGPKVDKHSTGGVGDKTSLIIAPAAAAGGLKVPMISGRGLGHTGGTLDKLESIPGFNVNITADQMRRQLTTIGCAMGGQSEHVAPADKRLYALRDVTGTVESPDLICASIMSKKLAEGIDALVLDVKTGSGAFMKSEADARHLAQLMVDTGSAMGKRVAALITDMDQPLGLAVGNALEVRECIDVLEGRGPSDLIELCAMLTAWMFVLGAVVPDLAAGEALYHRVIADGSALRRFHQLVEAQGGDLTKLSTAQHQREIAAKSSGVITHIECEQVGIASVLLGGGRSRKEDAIDPTVGMVLHKKCGNAVHAGEALCTIHFNEERRADEAENLIHSAYLIENNTPKARPLIFAVLESAASGDRKHG
ncbi:MAG: pyrimidine-nucleoside phosphorylase [Acidobacteriaceae bacterium]